MDAVAAQTWTEIHETTPPARLLAVRKAGAAFDGPFALRSPRFESLLKARSTLRAELAATRTELLDALHHNVPHAADRDERRRLLQLKRDVFNIRPPSSTTGLSLELSTALDRYASLLKREATLFARERAKVLAEQRLAIAALLEDVRFRLACRYSSAGLREALEHGGPPPEDIYSALERGLYAYAARFISKANPFHVFAEVLFPPAMGIRVDGPHEVVLDASVILDLEREVLRDVHDVRRVWLTLRALSVSDGKFRFWVPSAHGFRVFSVPESALLHAVRDFFTERQRSTGRPVGTRAACEEHLLARLGGSDPARATSLLSALIQKEIVGEYLVTDLGSFAPALSAVNPGIAARVDRLQRVHLARLDLAALAEAEAELGANCSGVRPGHYVNSYSLGNTAVYEAAAETLSDDLRALKPFFCAMHNYTANDAVAKAFLLDRLSRCGEAPLLDLLGPFMRELDSLIARFHPSRAFPGKQARRAAWMAVLAAESGPMDRDRLAELLPDPLPGTRSLCFNGPFDDAERVFYVSNVWAGDGRFVSRYLLHRRNCPAESRPAEPGCIDVELAVPLRTNLNYVVRTYATGCGFDSRYAHEFERWIDPAEVVVEASGCEVAYRHGPSGARLRFHYHCFLLAQYLPAEYQLLLVGHADAFRNPFQGTDSLAAGDEVRRIDSLCYGAVCLRRERWVTRAGRLAGLLHGDDPLRNAVRLRDWVHERLHPELDFWYYRTSGADGKGFKPHFLDLRNPLGVTAFRRALAALPADGLVSLSPMQPRPAHLHRDHGAPYVTELMVEA